ncbi:flavin reductase (DIM6/NTAB) family NADH-FMN oxidoreductase RutF [Tamaricihabitans halophyticus]|uniref:Flavin reductase (DIM6/NTAB) family NADH-FMN oxidoreductase RutF n=1 Tax=Tamaricihabitans halophyticus TaxID=1262583 RepID=A0A4V6NR02_9PSEU|nr:flavin reductase family protein [Tamaricihabitans halophyticus]TCP40766.1 flavin reductase (DIM6/NTAB) family NADH-FMN oxidoreductase RutF [Tamaricihabitans halophyticus]
MTSQLVDSTTMRQTMGRFATGVAVITTESDGIPHGMTLNSLTSVSLDPPLLLVCFNHGARSAAAVSASGRFVVNLLSQRQQPIAMRFAQRGEDHFSGLGLEYGDHSVPVVPNALAHLDCALGQTVEAGDHTVFFGKVTDVCTRDGEPLGFYQGRFSDVTPHGAEPEHWFF